MAKSTHMAANEQLTPHEREAFGGRPRPRDPVTKRPLDGEAFIAWKAERVKEWRAAQLLSLEEKEAILRTSLEAAERQVTLFWDMLEKTIDRQREMREAIAS